MQAGKRVSFRPQEGVAPMSPTGWAREERETARKDGRSQEWKACSAVLGNSDFVLMPMGSCQRILSR